MITTKAWQLEADESRVIEIPSGQRGLRLRARNPVALYFAHSEAAGDSGQYSTVPSGETLHIENLRTLGGVPSRLWLRSPGATFVEVVTW